MILISLALSSCVTTSKKMTLDSPPYEEPQGVPLSKVRFVTTTDVVTSIYQYDDRQCTTEKKLFLLASDHRYQSTKRNLGMAFNVYNDNAAKEVYVEANKELVFRVDAVANLIRGRMKFKYNCKHMAGVIFEEGKEYELRLDMTRWATFKNSKNFTYKCALQLYGITNESGAPQSNLLKTFKEEDLNTRGCNKVMYPEFQK